MLEWDRNLQHHHHNVDMTVRQLVHYLHVQKWKNKYENAA
jgi:hypothetical protein